MVPALWERVLRQKLRTFVDFAMYLLKAERFRSGIWVAPRVYRPIRTVGSFCLPKYILAKGDAHMLYPTLTEVQELLEEYDVVPVFMRSCPIP